MKNDIFCPPARVLRSIAAVFVTGLLLFGLPARGATAQVPSVSLNVRGASLERVLLEIKKQTRYGVVYTEDLLRNSKPVTVSIKNQPLAAALTLCFEGQPLGWRIVERSIIVTERPAQQPEPAAPSDTTITVTGRVLSSGEGQPIPGVTVIETGSGKGTVTNAGGYFVLAAVRPGATLQLRSVGFGAKQIMATRPTLGSIELEAVPSALNETVVIGYGTTTRRMTTSSISSVTAKEIGNQPVSNPLAAIQGRVPGLEIVQSSGVPGSSFKVLLRGRSSLDLSISKNDPLFIIDGVPFEPGNTPINLIDNATSNPTSIVPGGVSAFNTINPADIERIDVLKDADATAIYGSRGANGVILITTKKAKGTATEVGATAYTGWSRAVGIMDMLDVTGYRQMRREAFANDGTVMTAANAADMLLWDTTRNTDFTKLLVGQTARVSTANVYLSGGTAKTRFRLGAGYKTESTVFSSQTSDKVASLSANLSHESADSRFRMQFIAGYGNNLNLLPRSDLTRFIATPPHMKLYNEDGSLSWAEKGVQYSSVNNLTNPLAQLIGTARNSNDNLNASLNLSYKVGACLLLKVTGGYNRFYSDAYGAIPSKALSPFGGQLPSAYFGSGLTRSWIVEPQAEWSRTLKDLKVNVLAGATLQDKTASSLRTTGTNYSSDLLLGSIAAAGAINSTNTYAQYRYAAAFGRMNFQLRDKYLLTISGRRDGSSRFGPDKQWANFWAAGAGWIFSQEPLLEGIQGILSYGKLRGSYGITGNDQIGDYQFLDLWRSTPNTYSGVPGLSPIKIFNPDYNWEGNRKLELGLDLGFFSDRLLLTAGYYRNRCDNQLINYKVASQAGFFSVVRNFPGLVQNTGVELVVSTSELAVGPFHWSSNFNIAFPKNKLLRFPDLERSSYASSYVIGRSLSVIQGFRYLGVDPKTGVYQFEDVNGNGQLSNREDYHVFGDRDPDYMGGWHNSLRMGGWQLSFFLYFTKAVGESYMTLLNSPGGIANQPVIVMERWQREGDKAEVQRFTAQRSGPLVNAKGALSRSNGAFSDASFVRLKNVSLTYTLPGHWMKSLAIQRGNLYVEGQNLLTFTRFKGPDPETQSFFVLPPLRTIAAGIQLNF